MSNQAPRQPLIGEVALPLEVEAPLQCAPHNIYMQKVRERTSLSLIFGDSLQLRWMDGRLFWPSSLLQMII
jgi:hypothetical protein